MITHTVIGVVYTTLEQHRAGATGTAGTAMAILVLERERSCYWDCDLHTHSYITSLPSFL